MKSIEMNSSTKLAKLMKDYDLLIEIDNTREYFGKVVYKIPMEPKYYVYLYFNKGYSFSNKSNSKIYKI